MLLVYHNTPIGQVGLVESNGVLLRLLLPGVPIPPDCTAGETALLRLAARQLDEYFLGNRREFHLPLAPQGTPFQMQVWTALTDIPYGQTCTYGALAHRLGRPGGARAVGQANHRNPLPIFLPCHRVVASDGTLGGYTPTPEIKSFLLELERQHA